LDKKLNFKSKFSKRVIDILFSAIIITALSLIFLCLVLMVWILIGRPVLFQQTRPGLACKPFKMIKFRTMSNRCDVDGNLLPDAQRLSAFGRFLRSTSLDELPELWNVLMGDMSLVGPRPLLMEYLPLYSPEQTRRHEVRPGITGWAQVNGRNAISWDDKFKLDIWYVDNQSFRLDMKILFRTIKKVILRDGICADGEATMSRFKGTGVG